VKGKIKKKLKKFLLTSVKGKMKKVPIIVRVCTCDCGSNFLTEGLFAFNILVGKRKSQYDPPLTKNESTSLWLKIYSSIFNVGCIC
jgi:hypothetical protein